MRRRANDIARFKSTIRRCLKWYKLVLDTYLLMHSSSAANHLVIKLIGCLHDRANIEQLARRSMIISMLIRKAGSYNWKAYITRNQLWAKSLSLGLHLSQGAGF